MNSRLHFVVAWPLCAILALWAVVPAAAWGKCGCCMKRALRESGELIPSTCTAASSARSCCTQRAAARRAPAKSCCEAAANASQERLEANCACQGGAGDRCRCTLSEREHEPLATIASAAFKPAMELAPLETAPCFTLDALAVRAWETVAHERAPPPSKQILLCVWRN